MGFTSRKGISNKRLFSVILCLWLHGNNCEESGFKIYRSAYDIFTNLNYGKSASVTSSPSRTSNQCSSYGAECFDAHACKYCHCLGGRSTFMISDAGQMKGECKRDEDIVPESGLGTCNNNIFLTKDASGFYACDRPYKIPNEKFWLQNQKHNKCLYIQPYYFLWKIYGTSCSSPTLSMLWIWTNTADKQLMNVKTLRCMERPARNNDDVIMKICSNTYDPQSMTCTTGTDKKGNMRIVIGWKKINNHFLHLRKTGFFTTTYKAIYRTNSKQLWHSNETQPCGSKITYAGCYRFSDGSFMKYINSNYFYPYLHISAPIFKENDGNCTVMENVTFTRDGQKWETTKKLFSTSITKKDSNTRSLKFNWTEILKAFSGSLLKLSVACNKEEHCVLLKLKSFPSYFDVINRTPQPYPGTTSTEEVTTTFPTETTTGHDHDSTTSPSFKSSTEEVTTTFPTELTTTDYAEFSTTPTATYSGSTFTSQSTKGDKKGETSSELSRTTLSTLTSTTKNQQESVREETSESGGTNAAAIAVTVTLLLLALALALGYLVYYRRRKRAQVQQNNNNDIGVVNYSKEIYEDPDRIYETLDGVSPNQPGTTSDTYSYPDSNIIHNTTSSQQEYTYAKDTDLPRSSVSTKAAAEGPTSNGAVYETLEQPGQPTDDNFYNYLDNTNIAKPPASSELEYTYAKDTGLPRGNPNTKYETLEQPGQPTDDNFYNYLDNTNITKTPSRELEYTYVKDTDFPRGNPNTKVATQDPVNRAVYHTLEQPEQPNDDDFYHCPDNTNITKPPSSELDYSYAKDTDFPRGNPDTMIAIQDPANRAVYHTLEQPGKPDDDDFYHYPDNTNITKPPSSELEYIYAKDAEIPRVIADKKAAPETTSNAVYHTLEHEPPTGTNIPTDLEYTYAKDTEIPKSFVNAPAASDALYHTPGQEAPTEPEYSYAKNTDVPSIQLRTKQTTNKHSSPLPDNSGLYHTLEEPSPPQAPVYSTLEGPEDVENHKQVTDERPNFSDHTYIDVIEDSNKTDSRNAKNSSSVA